MVLPKLPQDALFALLKRPFWDCAAEVLNMFFPVALGGRDLGEGDGPPLRCIRHRIAVEELWDQKTGSFAGLRTHIFDKLGTALEDPGSWPHVAVDIALLFAAYGAAAKENAVHLGGRIHLACAAGEFTMPIAACLARQMGLPVGRVVCVCNENGLAWELLHRGEARLDGSVEETDLPLLDIGIPGNLERLVGLTLGQDAVKAYAAAREKGRSFILNPEQQGKLRRGFAVHVVGSRRAHDLIGRVYTSSDYLMSPYTALVYGGIMDFRAVEGAGEPVMLLAEESPMRWGEAVLASMGRPRDHVTEQISGLLQTAAEKRKVD